MNYKNHILFAITLNIIVLFLLFYYKVFRFEVSVSIVIYCFIIIILSSILPDLDSASSKIRGLIYFLMIFLIFYNLYVEDYFTILFLSLLSFYILLMKHRAGLFGLGTHSLILGLIIASILYFYYNNILYFIVFIVSFYSHLLADISTYKGKFNVLRWL